MKNPISAIIMILMWLGLGIGLIAIGKQGAREQRAHKDEVNSLSNRLVLAGSVLRGEVQRSTGFEKDLAQSKRAFSDLTNIFTQVSANLSQASNELAKTQAALKTDEEEVKRGNARIAGLENQNQALDQRALELGASLTNLTVQIEDTKRQLAASEGDKAILKSNLENLIAKKAELERQFNDIAILRSQVAKLTQNLTIARRRDWMRVGLFASSEQKGAQKLIEGVKPLHSLAMTPKPDYNLDVAVTSDGGVTVIPPPDTNGRSATNSPPR